MTGQISFFTLPSGLRNALLKIDTAPSTVPAIWGVLLNPRSHLLQATIDPMRHNERQ
jgi:hypothetical protein